MPRVKPKLMPRADEEEALRQAAHEFHDEAAAIDPREPYRTEREREIRAAALTRQGFGEDDFTELESSAYTLRGSSSFFRDAAIQTAGAQGYNSMPHPQHGGVDEARAPLATIRPHVERARHERTLSTVATAGGDFALNFTPTAAPGYVGRAFATAVRSKARLAQLLHHEPLPGPGVKIETALITTGTTAAAQTADNAAASNQDIVEALVTSNLATVAGYVDLSQQLLDHADPSASIDVVLATDLGNAVGTALDTQILYGTGANGQLRGFVNVSGISTVTKTNASPTGATNLAAIGNLAATTGAAYGALPDTLILHGRRLAFITSNNVGGFRWPITNVQEVPAIHTLDGGSTNADEAWAFTASEIWLFGGEPSFRVVFDHSGSNTLTCRFVATMYCGLLAHRQPAAIGRLIGSEFVAPPNY